VLCRRDQQAANRTVDDTIGDVDEGSVGGLALEPLVQRGEGRLGLVRDLVHRTAPIVPRRVRMPSDAALRAASAVPPMMSATSR
jgi:hypothetical protein